MPQVVPQTQAHPAVTRRGLLRGAAAAAALTLLAGCGGPGADAPSSAARADASAASVTTQLPDAPVTLDFYIETGFPLAAKLVDAFKKQHPNVTINIREDQFATLTQNAPRVMASDDAPDLIRLPTIVDSAKDGLLTNLDPYATAYGWDKYSPGLMEQLRVSSEGIRGSGPLYALGLGYNVTGVFYNKDLASRVGMTKPPATVDELDALLAKAKAAGVQPIMQFNDIGGVNFPFQALLNQYEDPDKIADWVFNKPGATLNTPGTVKAGDQIAAWGKAGYFPKDANALDYTNMMGRFTKGNGLFMFNGDWESQNLEKAMGDKVGFFLMPPAKAGGRYVAMSAPGTYAIPTKAKHPAETAYFLNWVHTDPAARKLIVETNGASPGGPTDLPIPAVRPGSVVEQTLKAQQTLGESGVAVDFTANATSGIYAGTIKPGLQSLITGRETGAGFAEKLQAAYEKELKR